MVNVADAIERLREPALAVMRELLGAEYAPGYTDTYYETRVQRSDPVSHYERRLLGILGDILARSYHEIGGGIGILPIALGIMGREAVNIDAAHQMWSEDLSRR